MRGKDIQTGGFRIFVGITPAYAGKSDVDCKTIASEAGSPPPMRGKEFQTGARFTFRRITPAYAGKSPILSNVHEVSQDHPRLCGEKLLFSPQDMLHAGSPPPMRGKV